MIDKLVSDLYAHGHVEGGADTVIDAQLVLERAVEAMKKDPYFFADKQDI